VPARDLGATKQRLADPERRLEIAKPYARNARQTFRFDFPTTVIRAVRMHSRAYALAKGR